MHVYKLVLKSSQPSWRNSKKISDVWLNFGRPFQRPSLHMSKHKCINYIYNTTEDNICKNYNSLSAFIHLFLCIKNGWRSVVSWRLVPGIYLSFTLSALQFLIPFNQVENKKANQSAKLLSKVINTEPCPEVLCDSLNAKHNQPDFMS